MPIAGLGLHVLVALFFAIHAVRSGQQIFWLFILFSFPLLGSIVYFLVIYLPDSRLESGARKAISAAAKSLDPSREMREARSAFDYAPTAQNQMRLASALLEAGVAEEAAKNYESCLSGPFSSDLEIRLGAARSYLACTRGAEAIGHLEFIRRKDPAYKAEQVSLLLAQSLSVAGRQQEARAEYENAVSRFGSFESKAEFAIWAFIAGESELATRLQTELAQAMGRWNRHNRMLNEPLIRRLGAAQELSRQRQ